MYNNKVIIIVIIIEHGFGWIIVLVLRIKTGHATAR